MSILKQIFSRSPEFITHIPPRILINQPIPLFCAVTNPGINPIIIELIEVHCRQDGKTKYTAFPINEPLEIRTHHWNNLFTITTIPETIAGNIVCEIVYKMQSNGKTHTISHTKTIVRTNDPLPKMEYFYRGDMLFYAYTLKKLLKNDIPVQFIADIAKAIGLNFFTAVEPYENDKPGTPTIDDSAWKLFLSKAEQINRTNTVIALTGEEIFCKTTEGTTLPIIIFNNPESYNCSASAHNAPGLKTFILNDVLKRAVPSSFSIIPLHKTRKKYGIQRSYFKDITRPQDAQQPVIGGLLTHTIPHKRDGMFHSQWMKKWIELLSNGQRVYITAGGTIPSDIEALQQKFSLLNLKRRSSQADYIPVYTYVYCIPAAAKDHILHSLKYGAAVITNGPILNVIVQNENNEQYFLGSEAAGTTFTITYSAVSTPETGSIKELRFYTGDIPAKESVPLRRDRSPSTRGGEELIFTIQYADNTYSIQGDLTLIPSCEYSYIRSEVFSKDAKNAATRMCIANPIWLRLPKPQMSLTYQSSSCGTDPQVLGADPAEAGRMMHQL